MALSSACTRQVSLDVTQVAALSDYRERGSAELQLEDGEVLHIKPRHAPRVMVESSRLRAPVKAELADVCLEGGDGRLQVVGEEQRSRLVSAFNDKGSFSFEAGEVESLSLELSGYAPPEWEPHFSVAFSAGGPALFASIDLTWMPVSWLMLDVGLGNLFGPTGAASPYIGARTYLLTDTALRPFIGAAAVQHLFWGEEPGDPTTGQSAGGLSADAVTAIVPRAGVDWHLYNSRMLVGAEFDLNIITSSSLTKQEEGFLTRKGSLNPWGGVRVAYLW